MKDENKTKNQLLNELSNIRKKLSDKDKIKTKHKHARQELRIIAEDITEQKISDTKLKETEKKYRSLFESTVAGVCVSNPKGEVLDANNAMCQLTGYPLAELFKVNIADTYVNPEDRKKFFKIMQKKGKVENFETQLKNKKEGKYWAELSASPIIYEGKNAFLTMAIDISDRKEAEKKLRGNEKRYRELFENISSGVAVYEAKDKGKDFIFKDFNRAGEKIEKIQKEKLIGKSVLEVFPGVREFGLFDVFQRVWLTGKPEYHPISLYKDERIIGWRENYVYKLPSGEIVAVYDNITERKKAEAALKLHAKQQEAISKLGQIALSEVELETLFNKTVKIIKNTLKGNFCKILELLPKENKLLLKSGVGWKKGLVGKTTVGTEKDSQAGYTLLSSKAVVVDDLRTEKRFKGPQLLIDHKVISGISVIIGDIKNPFGVLGIHTTVKSKFSQHDVNFIQSAANILANAINHKLSNEKIEHLNLVLQAIRYVNQLIIQEKDRSRLLKSTCKKLTMTQGYDSCWIALLDDRKKLILSAQAGLGKDFEPLKKQLKRGKLNECCRKALKKPGVIITKDSVSECSDCPLIGKEIENRALSIRLEHAGHIYGVMSISLPLFLLESKEEHDLFQEVSSDIAFALHNIEIESKQKKAEQALKESEKRLELALKGAELGTWDWNVKTGEVKFNQRWAEILEYSLDEIEPHVRSWEKLVHPDDMPEVDKKLNAHLEGKTNFYETVHRMRTKSGKWKWILDKGKVFERDRDGKPLRAVGTHLDISQRKNSEEKVRASLKEKEVMLQEIHHRVKNNLQIIISLLRLQARFIKDKEAKELFKDSQRRIRSMAIIHEKLYRSEDFAQVNFAWYIQSFSTHLFQTYMVDSTKIKLNMDVDDIQIDINKAIPCGILLNELVSNSIKHAFPSGRKGQIKIRLKQTKAGRVSLEVKDNGVGFPKNLDFRKPETLGLQLINDLSKQIRATLLVEIKAGTKITVVF
jgi:PAS domain S-box-containing protein